SRTFACERKRASWLPIVCNLLIVEGCCSRRAAGRAVICGMAGGPPAGPEQGVRRGAPPQIPPVAGAARRDGRGSQGRTAVRPVLHLSTVDRWVARAELPEGVAGDALP